MLSTISHYCTFDHTSLYNASEHPIEFIFLHISFDVSEYLQLKNIPANRTLQITFITLRKRKRDRDHLVRFHYFRSMIHPLKNMDWRKIKKALLKWWKVCYIFLSIEFIIIFLESPYRGGGTETPKALQHCIDHLKSKGGDLNQTSNHVIILTDGEHTLFRAFSNTKGFPNKISSHPSMASDWF